MAKSSNSGNNNQEEIAALKKRVAELEKSVENEKTEKSRLEKQLQEHEKGIDYKAIFANSPIGMVCVKASTGELMESNARAWEIFNLNPHAHSHINVSSFYLNKKDRERLLYKLKSEGRVEEEEVPMILPGGEQKWVTVSSVFYPEADRIETAIRDITLIKQSMDELKNVNDELDNFVYHASHDLRSPLRSVLGLLSILKVETDPEQRERCIEMIEGSIQRLDKLVVDLLSISRNNRVAHQVEKLNFIIEVNNTIESFYHDTDTKKLLIISHISEPVPFVCDAARVRIILNNLISNAIKYRSFNREYSFVKINIWVDEQQANLEIEDNGIGIPKSQKNQVFDMFYRASDNSEGSGLGLYIVKNVVEKLNGQITMESYLDKGTTFRVVLPNRQDDTTRESITNDSNENRQVTSGEQNPLSS